MLHVDLPGRTHQIATAFLQIGLLEPLANRKGTRDICDREEGMMCKLVDRYLMPSSVREGFPSSYVRLVHWFFLERDSQVLE